MTYLVQAKKEAKRLYSLAKSNPQSDLNIPSLSYAQKIVAFMNGYNNWHDFEQNLNKKDNLKEFNTGSLILSKPVQYLSKYDESYLKKYHLNVHLDNLLTYKEAPISFPIKINNQGLGIKAGTTTIKKTLSTKEYDVYFGMRNTTFWGMNGSGIHTNLESMAAQIIEKNCGLVYVNADFDLYKYTKIYGMCSQHNRLSDLYCLNFNAEFDSQTHSFDPINPMIPFKDNFLTMLGMQNNPFSEIFYALCLYCYEKNIALDSYTLLNFVAFKSLLLNKEDAVSVVINTQADSIKIYLHSLGIIDPDNTENDLQIIQKHHLNVQNLINCCNIIKIYEDRGIFSCYATINLEMILSQGKILLVLNDKDTNNKHIANELFITSFLTIQNLVFNRYIANITDSTSNLGGYLTINFFDNFGSIFNPITLSLFEKNLRKQKSMHIVNIIGEQTYNNALKATSCNHHPNINLFNEFVSHFEHHIIMKVEHPDNIPPIIVQQIVTQCEKLNNIFYHRSNDILDLHIGYGYYFYKGNYDIDEPHSFPMKTERRGFMRKINIYYYNCRQPKECLLINHNIMRN